MNIITGPKTRGFLGFILSQLKWQSIDDTPEWQMVEKAWTNNETKVLVTALDVVASHYKQKLDPTERSFLRGISDSLYSALPAA